MVALCAASVQAVAETRKTSEFLCLAPEDIGHFLRLIDAGFNLEQAHNAVNLSVATPEGQDRDNDWKCVYMYIEWDDAYYTQAGTHTDPKGKVWVIAELHAIKRFQLYGKWRLMPEWAAGWRFAYFAADSAFLAAVPPASTKPQPSECGNDCI